jgi:lipopolysaccharide transport system permease protein
MNPVYMPQVAEAVGVFARLRRLSAYRELTWMLTWRDIRVRYKHSMLGAAWAVIPPVMMMGIFTFVFGTVSQLDPQTLTGHASLPYSLFALSGLVPWTFFANSLQAATISLVSNRQLITKIYFPREVFPIAAVGSAFIDFLISTVVLIAFALFVHFRGGPWRFELGWAMLCLPIVVLVQLAFTIGLGLLLSMANLFYRDVGFLFRSFIQLWMFVTCVVYQLEPAAKWKQAVIQLNPMTPIIRAYRDCLLMNRNPFDWNFIQASFISVGILALGWLWFSRREFDFAERA